MRPWLHLKIADLAEQRPAGADDVHFPESLATAVIEYTTRGGRVLDPFAGYGTTPVVAERLQRHGIGVELLPERVGLIRSRLRADAEVIHGDARNLTALVAGEVDLCFTSPPWDVARTVARHLTLRHESFLCGDHQPQAISGDYCLVFQLRPDPVPH